MSDKDFQERMKYIARKCGSMSQLAKESGLSNTAIKGYISEGNEPTRPKLIAMAKVSGVKIEWLVSGEGPRDVGSTQIIENNNNIKQKTGIINAIEQWLSEKKEENPSWESWFSIELERKIPEFGEWRKAHRKGQPYIIGENHTYTTNEDKSD